MPNGKLKYDDEIHAAKYSILLTPPYFTERILKNGGAVHFVDGRTPITEYNALDEDKLPVAPKIHTIDATDSSIMAIGLEHLKGCEFIERIILNRCKHMENEGLEQLSFVKDTLHDLQVTECGNIEDSGLRSLKNLSHMRKLTIYGFLYVKNFNGVCSELKQSLPNCEIITNRVVDKDDST